jgi:phage shock protein A
MNRATTMMAEWDAAVAVDIKPRAPRLAELEDTISTLNRSVAKLRQANTELERKNQAAVTVIAELHTQLRAAQQAEPTGTVTPLLKQRQRRRW